MTNRTLLQTAAEIIDSLAIPAEPSWSVDRAHGGPRIMFHGKVNFDIVVNVGGEIGEWYDRTDEGEQRTVELEIRGFRVVAIETRGVS